MNLLPTNIGSLAVIADKNEGTRWAVTGIEFETLTDDNGMPAGWRACATDTKRLLRITGGDVGSLEEYPMPPAMESAPNGATKVLIPASKWDAFFKQAVQLTNKRFLKPILKSVALKIGDEQATFSATDLDSCPVVQTKLVEGKFPPADSVIPKKLRTGGSVIQFDARLLAETLNAINSMVPKDQASIVRVESWTNMKPVHISSKSCPGMNIEGIIMPCGRLEDPDARYDPVGRRDAIIKNLLARRHKEKTDSLKVVSEHHAAVNCDDVDDLDAKAEIARLVKELEEERAKVAEQAEELKGLEQCRKNLSIVEAKCRELAIERDVLQTELAKTANRSMERLVDTAKLANAIEKSNLAADQSNPAPKLTRAERLAKLKS